MPWTAGGKVKRFGERALSLLGARSDEAVSRSVRTMAQKVSTPRGRTSKRYEG